MNTIIDGIRSVIGDADFFKELADGSVGWDYGAMIEYFVASLLLLITVSSIFKLLKGIFR